MARDLEAVVAQTYQDEWARIVASLIRKFGDWDLAEECTQDAFAQALRSWRESGAPRNPGVQMAVDALRVAVPADRVEAICTSFVRQVREAVSHP